MIKKWIVRLAIVIAVVFVAIQFIPNRVSNPSTRDEPAWDSPRTRALAVAACYDCHSNQTKVMWFEKVAPLSWWIKGHVDDGREALNFSEWKTKHGEAGDSIETIKNGSMPPDYYTWFGLHSNAKLTAAEKKELADGLRATFTASTGSAGTGG